MNSDLEELRHWQNTILKQIHQNKSFQKLYSNDMNLNHYRSVSDQLYTTFGNDTLAKAGFLHGLSCSDIKVFLHDNDYEDILGILRGCESFDSFDPEQEDLYHHIVEILPKLPECRSILLYLFENLHHLDPKGIMRSWTNQFHTKATGFPDTYTGLTYTSKNINLKNAHRLCKIFSIIADSIGLRQERNILNNIALWYQDRSYIKKIAEFARTAQAQDGLCTLLVETISQNLPDSKRISTEWYWHHAASIHTKLKPYTEEEWTKNIYRCGYVTIIVPTDRDCYEYLYLLHKKFSCMHNQLRDYLWDSEKNKYRAIHTLLQAPDELSEILPAIPVRIIPSKTKDELTVDKEHPELILLRLVEVKEKKNYGGMIITFTPEGKKIPLRIGSTVLDFAYHLKDWFVAYLRSACINGRIADLCEQLADGDVVFLDIDKSPRPLPAGWESKVSEKSKTKIKRKFRRYFMVVLINTGRNFIKEQLLKSGISYEFSDTELDSYVEDAVQIMKKNEKLPLKYQESITLYEWIYLQLGIMISTQRGENYYYKQQFDRNISYTFINNLITVLKNQQGFGLNYIVKQGNRKRVIH